MSKGIIILFWPVVILQQEVINKSDCAQNISTYCRLIPFFLQRIVDERGRRGMMR